jgi:hypothetical protein
MRQYAVSRVDSNQAICFCLHSLWSPTANQQTQALDNEVEDD